MADRVRIEEFSQNLKQDQSGIWFCKTEEVISYPFNAQDKLFRLEDKSYWFQHRNNLLATVVKNFPPQDGVLFDIGGGNGVVAARLAEEGFQVILVEPGKDGAVNAKGRGLENVICASAQEANFKDNSLPAIGLFDVLEHIENDNDFLQFLRRKLIPEGVLYATVPAYQLLWSANDDYAGHFRRYTIENLVHLFNISGYQVVFTSHFFRFLPLVIFFQRSILYRLGIVKKITENKNLAREHAIRGGVVSSVMKTLLSVECKKIEKKESIRFGSSCLIVAKKSEK